MQLEFKLNRAALEDFVSPQWRGQIPFTMAHALTRTMIAARGDQQKSMERHIEGGPTRFTKSSIRYYPRAVNKRDLTGFLYYTKDAPYMRTIIDGGTVVAKKKKLSEPVNVKLDKFGNIPTGRGKNKYSARAKESPKFFFGIPRGRRGENYRGIWRRYGRPGYYKNGKPRGKIRLMVSWARGQRHQNESFPARKRVADFAPAYLRRQLPISFRRAIRSARSRPKPTGF